MFLIRNFAYRLSAAAVSALLLAVSPAAAQQRPSVPLIPPDAKGFQTVQILQEFARQQRPARTAPAAAQAAARPAPQRPAPAPPLTVVVAVPEPAPLSVAVRAPDGTVRNFALEGGREAIQTRQVIVRPGEAVTINLGPGRSEK